MSDVQRPTVSVLTRRSLPLDVKPVFGTRDPLHHHMYAETVQHELMVLACIEDTTTMTWLPSTLSRLRNGTGSGIIHTKTTRPKANTGMSYNHSTAVTGCYLTTNQVLQWTDDGRRKRQVDPEEWNTE